MNACNHCDINAEVAAIRAIVERLDHELLGNGQPGRMTKAEDAIQGLDRWSWYIRGALLVIGFIATAGVTIGGVALASILKH